MSGKTTPTTDDRLDGISAILGKMDQRFDAVDKRFELIDQKFVGIAKRFNSVDEQFNKLTTYIVTNFANIRQELAKKADKADVNELYKLMDSLAKREETDEQERLAMGHVQDRHGVWIHEISDQGGFTLSDVP